MKENGAAPVESPPEAAAASKKGLEVQLLEHILPKDKKKYLKLPTTLQSIPSRRNEMDLWFSFSNKNEYYPVGIVSPNKPNQHISKPSVTVTMLVKLINQNLSSYDVTATQINGVYWFSAIRAHNAGTIQLTFTCSDSTVEPLVHTITVERSPDEEEDEVVGVEGENVDKMEKERKVKSESKAVSSQPAKEKIVEKEKVKEPIVVPTRKEEQQEEVEAVVAVARRTLRVRLSTSSVDVITAKETIPDTTTTTITTTISSNQSNKKRKRSQPPPVEEIHLGAAEVVVAPPSSRPSLPPPVPPVPSASKLPVFTMEQVTIFLESIMEPPLLANRNIKHRLEPDLAQYTVNGQQHANKTSTQSIYTIQGPALTASVPQCLILAFYRDQQVISPMMCQYHASSGSSVSSFPVSKANTPNVSYIFSLLQQRCGNMNKLDMIMLLRAQFEDIFLTELCYQHELALLKSRSQQLRPQCILLADVVGPYFFLRFLMYLLMHATQTSTGSIRYDLITYHGCLE
jgi:hypothetical protein